MMRQSSYYFKVSKMRLKVSVHSTIELTIKILEVKRRNIFSNIRSCSLWPCAILDRPRLKIKNFRT
jgi:hypothetical protein